eukprot:CAMPEP_0203798628 /NCGR_PEP_ID=MMETSP0100_2-20121128/9404_1 /ASSEMBLY_ACC=CAM_ASM_000210 /TAXON_ID=96639 /ORGANISM=" , Strain NY0313808BC1" /LENGTH=67 /DNA_ID=CAMNT_0050704295 /DNA_START=119 /DNA_END=322 /DNA_ORIENTATION=-
MSMSLIDSSSSSFLSLGHTSSGSLASLSFASVTTVCSLRREVSIETLGIKTVIVSVSMSDDRFSILV